MNPCLAVLGLVRLKDTMHKRFVKNLPIALLLMLAFTVAAIAIDYLGYRMIAAVVFLLGIFPIGKYWMRAVFQKCPGCGRWRSMAIMAKCPVCGVDL